MTSITSVSSPNKMIASFHNSVLPKIESEPTYASLVEIRDALKENYASIPSRRGRVTFGYLGVILSNAVYDTISPGESFLIPSYPVRLNIPAGTTTINSDNLNRDHENAKRERKEWINLE